MHKRETASFSEVITLVTCYYVGYQKYLHLTQCHTYIFIFINCKIYLQVVHSLLDFIKFVERENPSDLQISECLDRICLLYELSVYFLILSIYNCIQGIYKQTNMLVLRAKKCCALNLLVSTISQTKQRLIIQTGIMRCHSHEREYFHSQLHYLHMESPTNPVTTQSTVAVSLERLLSSIFHCACSE